MSIEYRHPKKEDIEIINHIINQSAKDIPMHTDDTVEETLEFTFKDDEYKPEGYLLAFVDGEPAGYGGTSILKRRLDYGKNDAWIGLSMVPEHRNKGIEQHIVQFGIDYLKARKIGTAKRRAYGMEGWRHDISLEYGFKDIRHGYRMKWKKDTAPIAVPPPEGIVLEHHMFKDASDELVKLFADNFNTSFFDHYDFSHVEVKDFLKWRDIDRNITRMTFAKEGDKVAGVCMYEINNIYNNENNKKTGWANIMGVNPEFRKRGIARSLLSGCMRWLYDQGMDTVYLGMDAENSKALGLYTSLGYEIDEESISYALKLE